MDLNGYVPPIGAKKGNIVDQFLQYRKKFQGTVAHHQTSSPDWFKNATAGYYQPGNANALGTTNK